MSQRANYFKIGLFVLIAGALIVAGVIVLGVGAMFRPALVMETYFDESVQGLDVGSPVKFRGIKVGDVKVITMASTHYHTDRPLVLVRINFYPDAFGREEAASFELLLAKHDMEELLKEDIQNGLRVRLASQGLTGALYVEADYLDPGRHPPMKIEWDPEYPYVPSAPAVITTMTESLDRIMRNLEQFNLPRISMGIEQALESLVQALDAANVAGVKEEARQLLAELRETNKGLNRLVNHDAVEATAAIRRLIDRSEKPLAGSMAAFEKTAGNVERLAKRLDEASGNLPETMDELRNTLRHLDDLVVSQQRQIETSLENIRVISENLKELSENAKRHPSQLLFGGPPRQTEPGKHE